MILYTWFFNSNYECIDIVQVDMSKPELEYGEDVFETSDFELNVNAWEAVGAVWQHILESSRIIGVNGKEISVPKFNNKMLK